MEAPHKTSKKGRKREIEREKDIPVERVIINKEDERKKQKGEEILEKGRRREIKR
jgi:hypothetical protein